MPRITQTVTLRSRDRFGRRVPACALARVLAFLADAVRLSVRMAFEGRSKARGPRPDWLRAAADIRFIDHTGEEETVLSFEAPTLGEAAARLYEQREGWPAWLAAEDTGFDLFGDVLSDVAAQNADSERFDRPLLDEIARFRRAPYSTFTEMAVTARRYPPGRAALLTPGIAQCAQSLSTNTPPPQRVRVVGKLNTIRAGTQTFRVALDDGEEVRGVLIEGDITEIGRLRGQRVTVLGEAVYRPSGRVLRVDAEQVTATADTGSFFSTIPKRTPRHFDLRDVLRGQRHKAGVAAVFGKWPGDETDEQVEQALRELS
jgi:hypothetical protein